MANKKKEEDPNFQVTDPSAPGATKSFPKEPGVLDYLKEGFQPQDTRTAIDAIRKRRQKYGS